MKRPLRMRGALLEDVPTLTYFAIRANVMCKLTEGMDNMLRHGPVVAVCVYSRECVFKFRAQSIHRPPVPEQKPGQCSK